MQTQTIFDSTSKSLFWSIYGWVEIVDVIARFSSCIMKKPQPFPNAQLSKELALKNILVLLVRLVKAVVVYNCSRSIKVRFNTIMPRVGRYKLYGALLWQKS